MKTHLFLLLLLIPFASANVIITEVHYDPSLSESDSEYIELYNLGDEIDISGWKLNTTSIQATIPDNTVLKANTSFLIADEDDNEVWPEEWSEPDFVDEITLPNTNSGVQLLDSQGQLVDVVGWGDSLIYEGTPADDVDEGTSLSRNNFVDTNNNSFDFSQQSPSPTNSNAVAENEKIIEIYAEVLSNPPILDSFTLTPDDSEFAGIQVIPNPGATKNLVIKVNITDYDEDLETPVISFNNQDYLMVFVREFNTSSVQYSLEIPLNYYLAPENYSVDLFVEDTAGNNLTSNQNIEYLELIAFEIDTPQINFSGKSGSYVEVLGDHDMTTPNPTVRNIGNTQLDFEIRASDLNSVFDTITVNNLKYSFLDNDFESGYGGSLGTSKQLVPVGLNYGISQYRELTIALEMPRGTVSGNYHGQIYINAVST